MVSIFFRRDHQFSQDKFIVFYSRLDLSSMSGFLQFPLGPEGRSYLVEIGADGDLSRVLVMEMLLPCSQTIGCQMVNNSVTFCLLAVLSFVELSWDAKVSNITKEDFLSTRHRRFLQTRDPQILYITSFGFQVIS